MKDSHTVTLAAECERAEARAAALRSLAQQLVEDINDITGYPPETSLDALRDDAGQAFLIEQAALRAAADFAQHKIRQHQCGLGQDDQALQAALSALHEARAGGVGSALFQELKQTEARAAALRAALKDAIWLLGRWTDGSRAVLLDRESELSRFNELAPRARAALAAYDVPHQEE